MIRRFAEQTTTCLLGVRFWDSALDRAIDDGLEVMAWPAPGGRTTAALRTPSGVYAFHQLPGLRSVAWPDQPEALPAPRPFVVAVRDRLDRFLPASFLVNLPLPYRGIYPTDAPSSLPRAAPAGLLLFSAPTRPIPAGLAVVRAQLVDEMGAPAAHAVIEIEISGRTVLGVADRRGCVLALFPYPRLPRSIAGSLPGPAPDSQRWQLSLRVRYEPGALASANTDTAPDIRQLLGQAHGQLWPDEFGGAVDTWEAELSLGRELVLISAQSLPRSTLIISSGGSW